MEDAALEPVSLEVRWLLMWMGCSTMYCILLNSIKTYYESITARVCSLSPVYFSCKGVYQPTLCLNETSSSVVSSPCSSIVRGSCTPRCIRN